MKTVFAAILFLSATLVYAEDKPKTESRFELKEIYLQVNIQKPLLVTKEPVPKQFARLGDSLRMWLTAQLRPGAKSPCTSRDEEQCHLEFRIAAKDADRSKLEYVDFPTRINDEITFSTGYPIRRDSTLGEKVFLFRVRFKDQILYTFEFPLEVRE